jgi:hypothetical protein
MAESGFYTNRILYSEMMALFRQAGFAVDVLEVNHWDRLPTPRPKLCGHFQHLSEDELCISGFEVILRPDCAAVRDIGKSRSLLVKDTG